MKSVMISIQPKWCELIASGKKTIEVRKTRPKIDVPFKCYIYCTSSNIHECLMLNENGTKLIYALNYKTAIPCGGYVGNGKVIGEFVCDYIEDFKDFEYEVDALHRHIKLNACIDYNEIYKYLGSEKYGYGWHISDLVIYEQPKELSEFRKYISFLEGESISELEEAGMNNIRLKRPPQSWCYVEG